MPGTWGFGHESLHVCYFELSEGFMLSSKAHVPSRVIYQALSVINTILPRRLLGQETAAWWGLRTDRDASCWGTRRGVSLQANSKRSEWPPWSRLALSVSPPPHLQHSGVARSEKQAEWTCQIYLVYGISLYSTVPVLIPSRNNPGLHLECGSMSKLPSFGIQFSPCEQK